MSWPPGPSLILAVTLAVGAAPALAAPVGPPTVQSTTAAPPTEAEAARVRAIGAELRCVVCQALSVADSPSTTAEQMRGLILEQLRQGRSPEEIKAYFVSRYGEWVLLSPRASGFNLLAWWLPAAGILFGVAGVLMAARRWVARGKASAAEAGAAQRSAGGAQPAAMSASDRERLERELAGLRR